MIKTKKTLFALSLWSAMAMSAFAQGTAFTYQGQLSSGGSPANGTYDVQFTLFSVSSGGSAIGSPAVKTGLGITNGLFTTALDFGGVFNGTTNWLELAVRTNGASSFSPPLTPRQQLTPTPYAVYAESANASNLVGTVAAANLPANAALLGANQTFTASNNFNGTVTITKSASGVPSGSSIDGSTFLHVNNAATDGNTSSPDFAGIAFGNNSTRQAIVGGTFGNDYLDFYTGGLLTTPKMRIDFNGNVGIGSLAPLAELSLGQSGSVTQLELLKPGSNLGYQFTTDASGLDICERNIACARFYLQNGTGNIGIGTGTPTNKLDVQGSADFTGNVGIGTTTPNSDSSLQVKGLVRMGSETGTTEVPTKSILLRRINSSATATGTVVARSLTAGAGVITLERDGTAGGLVLKATGSAADAQIVGFGINTSNAVVTTQSIFYGGTSASYQVFTDAQKISYLRLSFGDAANPSDFTTVEAMRAVDNLGNNLTSWIGTVTSTVNQ